jgi:hypothetical protein
MRGHPAQAPENKKTGPEVWLLRACGLDGSLVIFYRSTRGHSR